MRHPASVGYMGVLSRSYMCHLASLGQVRLYIIRVPYASSSGLNRFKVHDDVIKWKQFPRYWPFVRGIHRSPVNSPHKGQWRGALMFSLICISINDWVNNREAGDLRRYRGHYDVTVMRGLYHPGHICVSRPQWVKWRVVITSAIAAPTGINGLSDGYGSSRGPFY